MAVEYFLDANVLVYAVSAAASEAAKKQRAVELIARADFGVSAQVLQEFYVTATRKIKTPISTNDAQEFIRSLAKFPFVPTDWPLIQRACEVSSRYQTSYWDGAIIAAAERLQASIILSEDFNHGQTYGTARVENPFR